MDRHRAAEIVDLEHALVEQHAKQTIAPAMIPMMTDAVGPTKAHGAVIATRPASMPLHAIEMSGLPKSQYHRKIAVAEPLPPRDSR